MSKRYVALLVLLPILMTACGSAKLKSDATSKTTQANELRAEQMVKTCMPKVGHQPDPALLRSHAQRTKFANCLGLEKGSPKRLKFGGCLTTLLFSGLPTKARLTTGASKCLAIVL